MTKLATKEKLSLLWIFVTVNYIFCDVFTLFYGPNLNQYLSGSVGGMELTQEFLLTFAIIMELVLAMIILSRILNYKANRWANIIIGVAMTFIQAGTLIGSDSTLHYLFFSAVEISTTAYIAWIGLTWKEDRD